MAEHNELGKKGEEMALGYLRKNGYRIRDTNWRFGKNEIDIIADKNNFLVIVEVKTKKSNYFSEPEASVTKKKQGFMIRAANAYIKWNNINLETRFDIIAIIINQDQHEINHIHDAFYPTLYK